MSNERILVPVAPSSTLRATVEYAVDAALDAEGDAPLVRFVYVHSPEEFDVDVEGTPAAAADDLLDRVEVWAGEDAGDREADLAVETAHLGMDRYLFSPNEIAAVILEDARAAGIDRIVIDPEYDPGVGAPLLRPLEYELTRDGDLTVEEAPVQQQVRRTPLALRTTARRLGILFGVGFLFYQVLAGGISTFDLVTGAITATIVAVSLSRISLAHEPGLVETPLRIVRGALYLPYLLWEIVRANVAIAAVILNPRLPIDPRLTRIEPAVYGALPVTSLANSITLTPGTLTVRVEGRQLLVHTLVPSAREDLFDGGLERAIRFVFYGRRAMRIDSLVDRNAAELVPAGAVGSKGWTADASDTDESGGDEGGDGS